MTRHVTAWGWYWLLWFFAGFGLPEAYGLILNARDTLSWQLWGLEHLNFGNPFDFSDWTPLHYMIGCILLLGFLWLFVHLTFGLLR